MNLVFGSIFLFILISPGLIFRFSYLQGSYAKLNFKVSAVEELFWALVPALFFQVCGVLFVIHVLHIGVRLEVIYNLITGSNTVDIESVKGSLPYFLLYLALLIIISVLFGILSRIFIRILKLDHRWQFLRFGNEWYYLLSGEMMIEPDVKKISGLGLFNLFSKNQKHLSGSRLTC